MLHFKANMEKLRECGQTCDCPLQLFNVDWWTLWCQDRLGLTGKDMQVRHSFLVSFGANIVHNSQDFFHDCSAISSSEFPK